MFCIQKQSQSLTYSIKRDGKACIVVAAQLFMLFCSLRAASEMQLWFYCGKQSWVYWPIFSFGGKATFYGCFKLLWGLITNTVFNFILCPKSKENSMAIICFLGTEFQFYILKGGVCTQEEIRNLPYTYVLPYTHVLCLPFFLGSTLNEVLSSFKRK